MKYKNDCGCAHDGERWLALCDSHQVEQSTHAAREAARHIARATSDFIPTPEYAALAAKHRQWLED